MKRSRTLLSNCRLLDGPTGNTFIYVLEEGWRFVGRVADRDL